MATPVETVASDHRVSSRRLIASVIGDAQRLVALEVALARQEMKELATGNAIAAGLTAFGGLLVLLAILVAVPSLVVILVPWHWQAAAAWIGAYVVIGAVLLLIGRARMRIGLRRGRSKA
jgi:putative superfamily III holin-X